ncbi:MAG: PAS domain-containing protein, partial [Ktedonobacteraceae bacterium]|nr:PAS domain-containing protein [Ktedonobacteraceae bacterium]
MPTDRFLAVIQGTADLFWILSSTGMMDDISHSWLSFTGQEERDACGNGWLDAVYPIDQPDLKAFLAHPLANDHALEHTCHIRRNDGIYRLMRLLLFPVCTVSGTVCELVVSGTDITLEHMNDAQIQLALELSGVGLWRYDLGTQHFVATEQWKQLYGLSPDDPVTFERFLALVHPEDRAQIEEVKTHARAEPGPHNIQFRITRPDGSLRWMISRLQYLADVPSQSRHLIGSALDITEVKATEEQITQILEST